MDIDVSKLDSRENIIGAIGIVCSMIKAQLPPDGNQVEAPKAPEPKRIAPATPPVQTQPLYIGPARLHRNQPLAGLLQS